MSACITVREKDAGATAMVARCHLLRTQLLLQLLCVLPLSHPRRIFVRAADAV
jgi:hypothetical protein